MTTQTMLHTLPVPDFRFLDGPVARMIADAEAAGDADRLALLLEIRRLRHELHRISDGEWEAARTTCACPTCGSMRLGCNCGIAAGDALFGAQHRFPGAPAVSP